MTALAVQLTAHLVTLRQAGLAETGGLARRMRRAFADSLSTWAAWLQTRPDDLVAVLHVLTTHVALHRHEAGLPLIDAPAPVTPADPPLVLHGPAAEHALLDRLGVMLATFPDWRIEVTLDDGSTVTARPARAPLTPEQAPAGVTG